VDGGLGPVAISTLNLEAHVMTQHQHNGHPLLKLGPAGEREVYEVDLEASGRTEQAPSGSTVAWTVAAVVFIAGAVMGSLITIWLSGPQS
jgi:hypothetical protein